MGIRLSAATGIGTQYGGILIDFNAVSGEVDIVPLDNDWQRAAHVYSDEVLISHRADTEKGTPKFERGKSVSDRRQEVIYISGHGCYPWRGKRNDRRCTFANGNHS